MAAGASGKQGSQGGRLVAAVAASARRFCRFLGYFTRVLVMTFTLGLSLLVCHVLAQHRHKEFTLHGLYRPVGF